MSHEGISGECPRQREEQVQRPAQAWAWEQMRTAAEVAEGSKQERGSGAEATEAGRAGRSRRAAQASQEARVSLCVEREECHKHSSVQAGRETLGSKSGGGGIRSEVPAVSEAGGGSAWTRVAAGGCRIWDASGDRGLTDRLGRGRKEPGTTPGLGVGVSG